MSIDKIRRLWLVSTVSIVALSYCYPAFGVVVLVILIVLIGTINAIFSVRSSELGRYTACTISLITFATALGANLGNYHSLIAAFIGGIVGFIFTYAPVTITTSTKSRKNNDKSSARGGKFGGGGASGDW